MTKTKNINFIKKEILSINDHKYLKKYCEKNGLKMYKFLENLIVKTCAKPKDIYGED